MRKHIYMIIIYAVAIFLSYIYIQPLGSGTQEIVDGDYQLQVKKTDPDDQISQFGHREDNKFFIQLGEQGSPKATFEMQKSLRIAIYFSLYNSSSLETMLFKIRKNSEQSQELVAVKGKLNKIALDVERGDTIEIDSSTIATSINDWAIMKINTQEPLFVVKNFTLSIVWIILLVLFYLRGYIYIFISSYGAFVIMVLAEKLNFGSMSFETLATYLISSLILALVSILLYQLLERWKIDKIVSLVLSLLLFVVLTLPLTFIIYIWSFQKSLSKEILYAVFQTNSEESLEFISTFISLEYIWATIVVVATIFVLYFIQSIVKKEYLENRALLFAIITLSAILSINFHSLKLPNFVIDELTNYKNELRLFKELKEKREDNKIEFNATKKEQGETHVVVIGESLNKKHMGLYGYFRETTPNLSAMQKDGSLLRFDNVYANHVNTALVLEYALTEANQYNQKKYYNSISIIEILKKADIETCWLSNQVLYGAWDNAVSVIGTTAKYVVSINRSIGKDTRTQKLDDALIEELTKILQEKSDKNRVIFIHLIGNHFNYLNRYPKEGHSHYQGDLTIGEYGFYTHTNSFINSYDNSIRYNDLIIASMIKALQKSVEIGTFLYISDHSEDVIGLNGHNVDKFTFDMIQIPMVIWANAGYKEKYKDQYNNLVRHKSQLFSNDMLYDTMIGMFHIDTDKYNPIYDLSSKEYNLTEKSALVLHGKKEYQDAENYRYWQKSNTRYLKDLNQSSRVFPHRVDSIGKLNDIWSDGFRSFETDIRYGDNNSKIFRVGHDLETQGVSLEEFISSVDTSKIERIWLDLKNIDKNNYREVLERLEYIDKRFHIKERVIFESSTIEEFFKLFGEQGWQTSYYLPTEKIVTLLANDNSREELQDLANKIAKQIKEQNVTAISFDERLYPFVKSYLEPKILEKIIYHTWYGPSLFDTKFQSNLQNNQLYRDTRVKTILSKYISHFSL